MAQERDGKPQVIPFDHGDIHDLTNSLGHGFQCLLYGGLYLPRSPPSKIKGGNQLENYKSIKAAQLNIDDVVVCAYPKCGSHWLFEVLGMLTTGSLHHRKSLLRDQMIDFIFKDGIESLPPPRLLATHLPLRMLPTQVAEKRLKCIQIRRNPKDACVSMYNNAKNMTYEGTFAEFTEAFLSGKLPYGSYHGYLTSWAAEVSPEQPVFYLYYEDMKVNPLKCVKDMARFLDLDVTDKFCEDLIEACSFKNLKEKEARHKQEGIDPGIWKKGAGGTFYRKGEIGDWKNWFTVAENERFDQIWDEKMKNSGMKFIYSV
ncbi:sulfotransferase 1A2-like isoform X2 [Haliotis rubra]|uniref:sulfotransferase 1A2-like isoform X2 n=1 Tax=Haliotis rubra TaxID=36100 RepID=UPI001EE57D63|nr:sulfotransferase 1A2-like isoform X2 [Haliotis rubra]